jgi:multicomponent Na+:H+ antiporter subunit F
MIMMVIFGLLITAIFLGFIRLVHGPSLADRVVALDLIAILSVGVIALYAVYQDQTVFIDVAVVLALIGFLGTIAFAYFIEKGELPWRRA